MALQASRFLRFRALFAGDARRGLRGCILLRYLVRELLLYFFICFLFFFMAFFINQILLNIARLLGNRAPMGLVLKFLLYCLPTVVFQAVPFATLVGFLMCLGRLVSDNEVLVLRATGHGYGFIMLPVMLLGLGISSASFMINDCLIPLSGIKMRRLHEEIAHSNPATQLETDSVKRANGSVAIVCGTVDGSSVSDLVFLDTAGGGMRVIAAGRSRALSPDTEGVLMTFDMQDAKVFEFGSGDRYTYDYLEAERSQLNIFTSAVTGAGADMQPQDMTVRDLYAEIRSLRSGGSKARARVLNRYMVEFMNKFSFPFAAFFFAVFAMPVAVILGKSNGQTNGLIIGVIMSGIYWTVWVFGKRAGFNLGWNAFVVMWTPNFLIGAVGMALYLRLLRK